MSEPFYITTAISYPNGRPHIGHAYEAIAADAIARFHRLSGQDARLITGTDEHGLKMVQTAARAGVSTQALADEMSGYFKEMCAKLNVAYTQFVRTTEPRHHDASIALWKGMEAAGDLYLDRYEGWYSVRDEAFYDEKELVDGEGGVRLSPQGTPVEWTVEESWFFRLSRYQEPLLKLFADNPGFIQPDNGGADAFVHISAVERAGLGTLNEGQKVEFELVADRRSGKMAADNLKTTMFAYPTGASDIGYML